MADFFAYSKRKIRAYAYVEGNKIPIVSIYTEFSLNAIPLATVSLPVGYDADTLAASLASGSTRMLFGFRKKIDLWVEYTVEWEEDATGTASFINSQLDPGMRVFEGYISGFGYERTVAGMAITMSIEHWLSDLAASSALSGATHSTTPGDMQRSALLRRSATAGSNKGGVAAFSYINNILIGELTDLWEDGYKKIYTELCKHDQLVGLDSSNAGGGKNDAGLAALSRMYSSNAKLELVDIARVKTGVIDEIRATSIDSLSGQTLWDSLIAASASYMFAVSPHVEDAEVFPFCPGVHYEPQYKFITPDQITNISFSGDCPRTIRGVALMYGTGVRVVPGSGMQSYNVIGKYINDISKGEGTVIYRNSPSWIQNSPTDSVANTVAPIPTAVNPAGAAPANKVIPDLRDIRNKFAKTIYGFEVLKGRQGSLSGPLRQDIGVGSYLKIELPKDMHSGDTKVIMFGVVLRVSSTIIAQSSQSSTTFTIGYLRMESEISPDSMIQHPLYKSKWSGSSNLKMNKP